jgi:hypothetical protein
VDPEALDGAVVLSPGSGVAGCVGFRAGVVFGGVFRTVFFFTVFVLAGVLRAVVFFRVAMVKVLRE